jgi:molybdate transport system ATP-binding protein
MIVEASISLELGTLHLEVDLAIDNEIVAVLGPNGSGKTTLLRALAGLTPIDAGRIEIDGSVVDHPASRTFVLPEDRPIGVVFQDYLLFPFLSALENVAFGLRSRKVAKREARRRSRSWLARFGLEEHAAALPSALSGGQAQRVALARAIVNEPKLLLLDEPLSALDAGARIDIRRELRDHLSRIGGARLIVTHDLMDAAALADRVVILEAGRIVQEGQMDEIALRPRSNYVAELVGLNLIRGTAEDGVVAVSTDGEIVIADHSLTGPVCVAIHPRSVTILLEGTHGGSARNHWPGTVVEVDLLGERVRVRIEGAVPIVAEVTAESARALALEPGRSVVAAVKATEVTVYPR